MDTTPDEPPPQYSAQDPSLPVPPAVFSVTATKGVLGTGMVHCLSVACSRDAPLAARVIALVDVSGSMATASTDKEKERTDTANEVVNLSRLDLVKHSLNTLAAMLHERGGSLCLISFSNYAEVVLPTTSLSTAATLAEARRVIAELHAAGGTNIWEALNVGIGEAISGQHGDAKNNNTQVILLTDGEPSPEFIPPKGIIDALRRGLAGIPTRNFNISAFGYGYNLDSLLMKQICELGDGAFGYIPDCSMVGTVFINFASGVLSTVARQVSLHYDGQPHALALGNLQHGMPKHVTLHADHMPASIRIQYDDDGQFQQVNITAGITQANADAVIDHNVREQVIDCLRLITAKGTLKPDAILNIKQFIHAEQIGTPFALLLLRDAESDDAQEGQLLKAVSSTEWFKRWGLNHLIGYQRALQLQLCHNFKDVAVQQFSGPLFEEIQQQGYDLFCSLPAPTAPPSPAVAPAYGTAVAAAPARRVDMSQYVRASGGCFHPCDHVVMDDGTFKAAGLLKKGDIVAGGFTVRCAIHIGTARDQVMYKVGVNGPVMTAYHPILREGSTFWKFPITCTDAQLVRLDWYHPAIPIPQFAWAFTWTAAKPLWHWKNDKNFVVNLVLDQGHAITFMGGVTACTLGHGFETDAVIKHEYYGTERVIQDLMAAPGWEKGFVLCDNLQEQRDYKTGRVTRVVWE